LSANKNGSSQFFPTGGTQVGWLQFVHGGSVQRIVYGPNRLGAVAIERPHLLTFASPPSPVRHASSAVPFRSRKGLGLLKLPGHGPPTQEMFLIFQGPPGLLLVGTE
jgi:hypothetical protein